MLDIPLQCSFDISLLHLQQQEFTHQVKKVSETNPHGNIHLGMILTLPTGSILSVWTPNTKCPEQSMLVIISITNLFRSIILFRNHLVSRLLSQRSQSWVYPWRRSLSLAKIIMLSTIVVLAPLCSCCDQWQIAIAYSWSPSSGTREGIRGLYIIASARARFLKQPLLLLVLRLASSSKADNDESNYSSHDTNCESDSNHEARRRKGIVALHANICASSCGEAD
jgi:hypothetical protein